MALQTVALTEGAYTARSIIASAQRQLNLFSEANPKDSTFPFTNYPTPGLRTLLTAPAPYVGWRCLYAANSGDLYGVSGDGVFYIRPDWTLQGLGAIGTSSGMVSIADNGATALLVDGTPLGGWQIDLPTRVMTQVNPTDNSSSTGGYGFVGADRVQAIDGYLLLNAPGTNQFYSTDLEAIAFDPFWFAAKNGYSDNLVSISVIRREIWLIGQYTSEIWFDAGGTQSLTGASDFPFTIMPGPFNEHGCAAKWSVAQAGGALFMLSQSLSGARVAMMGEGYQLKRISTHAMETEWATYGAVSDAVGFCYQQEGHTFYQLTFPSADKTWCYDLATQLWHERGWIDGNGIEHRHRANCSAFAYGLNVVGDWQNGKLYALDLNTYTDDGAPIRRVRSWPHLVISSKRVIYRQFIADMEVGTERETSSFPTEARVHTDSSLACRGITADPLKVSIVDGALPAIPAPPQPPADGTVSTDDSMTGTGVQADPLSIIFVDGSIPDAPGAGGQPPWVTTDTSLSGDGSPAYPLSVNKVDGRIGIPPCTPTPINEPVVTLRWSDSRGAAWGNPIRQGLGAAGEYLTQVQWQRLGLARDRVFEVGWSAPVRTALNGAWVDSEEASS